MCSKDSQSSAYLYGSNMAVPLLLVTILLCGSVLADRNADDPFQNEKSNCSWECMTFALMWPSAFCMSLTKKLECNIPQGAQSWIIHGLWPMYEEMCCECWPIFPSDLEELEPDISQLWPSLLKAKPNFVFWMQEWKKHGACAACREGFNSPTKYFQITLKLRAVFNVERALMDAGIKPSCNKTYQLEDLQAALTPLLGSIHEIQCMKDDAGRQVLIQLKVSMYQNFTLGCHQDPPRKPTDVRMSWLPSPGHPCPQGSPVYFFPISLKDPRHPCN
ncbi:hypothetical protein GJAV_G00057930 [Gymnothorax javanicus]|nr:hypothetical protein GJAV_G00057930 [Gymnothorax javanicus]